MFFFVSGFLVTDFAVLLLESNVYNAPPPNTSNAPITVPTAKEFPNSQMLRSRLTSFRILRTIVTVKAEDAAASKLTPRMHAYCVKMFAATLASWLGA